LVNGWGRGKSAPAGSNRAQGFCRNARGGGLFGAPARQGRHGDENAPNRRGNRMRPITSRRKAPPGREGGKTRELWRGGKKKPATNERKAVHGRLLVDWGIETTWVRADAVAQSAMERVQDGSGGGARNRKEKKKNCPQKSVRRKLAGTGENVAKREQRPEARSREEPGGKGDKFHRSSANGSKTRLRCASCLQNRGVSLKVGKRVQGQKTKKKKAILDIRLTRTILQPSRGKRLNQRGGHAEK